jgi:hypothetical protein
LRKNGSSGGIRVCHLGKSGELLKT